MKHSRLKFDRIDRGTMHSRVYAALKDAIMGGHFLPGQKITVRLLAEEFGTSPMPVREAVRRLVAEQALEILPNRTVIIPLLSPQQLTDLRRIRVAFEGLATAWAAETISKDEVDQLTRLHNEMRAVLAAGQYRDYLDKNREFHFVIYRAARSPKLLPILESLWLQIGPYFNLLEGKTNTEKLFDLHARAITALSRHKGERACEAIQQNISYSADVLIDSIPPSPGPAARTPTSGHPHPLYR
jgi:DNA-binding GntR family transcriptional regulator